jgi:hypothetical protein
LVQAADGNWQNVCQPNFCLRKEHLKAP